MFPFFVRRRESTGHAASVIFEVFPQEKKLRDGDPIGFLQLFMSLLKLFTHDGGVGKNGFRGEHPSIEEGNNAGNDHGAFLNRGGSPELIYAVTICTGKLGKVNLLA